MIGALLTGAGVAGRRWPLVLALWLLGIAFGAAFALASAAWLTEALAGSLATRTLLHRIDPDVLVDLWAHHREGLTVLLVLAAVLGGVHIVLWWWLYGVVVAAIQRPARESGTPWAQGLALAPVMAQLFVLALFVLAIFSAAVGAAAYALLRWTRSDPSPFVWYDIGAAALAAWAIGFVFLAAVHDHARLRACRARQSALAAYRWALGFVWHGGERAFLVACMLQLSALLLWVGYQAIGLTVPVTELLGLTGSLLWAEAYLLVRVWVRLWFFAAQNELQA